jgi:hypothetical protein
VTLAADLLDLSLRFGRPHLQRHMQAENAKALTALLHCPLAHRTAFNLRRLLLQSPSKQGKPTNLQLALTKAPLHNWRVSADAKYNKTILHHTTPLALPYTVRQFTGL